MGTTTGLPWQDWQFIVATLICGGVLWWSLRRRPASEDSCAQCSSCEKR